MKRRHFALGAAAALGGSLGYPPLRDWVAGDRDMPGLRYRRSIRVHGPALGMALTLSADASRVAVLTDFGHDLQIFDSSGTLLRRELQPAYSVEPSLGMAYDNSVVLTAMGQSRSLSAMLTLVPTRASAPFRYAQGPNPGQDWSVNGARDIAVSTNGRWAITTADPTFETGCEIVDLVSLSRTRLDLTPLMPTSIVLAVNISSDGALLAVHAANQIMMIDRITGHVKRVIDSKPFAACFYGTTCFSPDGRLYAVATGALISVDSEDPVPIVKIFDVQTGALFREIVAPPMSSPQMSWSADGKRLAVGLHGSGMEDQLMLITPHSDAPPTRHHFVQRNAIHFAANAPVFGILRDRWVDLFDCIWA